MARGRPVQSQIRQNIIEILHFMGDGYAYDLYKTYLEVFPPVTMRSIYYHLKKGLTTQEFKLKGIKKEKGNYSWGTQVEKIYYELGPSASPAIDPKVKDHFDRKS
ncbi:hypothetical protein ACFL96_05870 [Thermoproteota archaeon]